MATTSATNFRKNLFEYLSQVAVYNEPLTVSTKNGNVVIVSEDDYRSLVETLALTAVPGFVESVKAAREEPVSDAVEFDPEEEW